MKRLIGYTAALCLLAITVGCGGVTKHRYARLLSNSTGTGFTVFSVNTDGTLTTAYISPLPTPQPPKLVAFSPNGKWVYFLDDAGDQHLRLHPRRQRHVCGSGHRVLRFP